LKIGKHQNCHDDLDESYTKGKTYTQNTLQCCEGAHFKQRKVNGVLDDNLIKWWLNQIHLTMVKLNDFYKTSLT
jgi:hypothetical protein